MTDTFTPEEWQTAAKVARRSVFGNKKLADAWDKAAAQAAERKAKEIDLDKLLGIFTHTGHGYPDDPRRAGLSAILHNLAENGHLATAGGMVIDADTVEDIREFLSWAAGPNIGAQHPDAAANRLRAVFTQQSWTVSDATAVNPGGRTPARYAFVGQVPFGVRFRPEGMKTESYWTRDRRGITLHPNGDAELKLWSGRPVSSYGPFVEVIG
ncbi:hypothetical protein [Cellulomonas sp. NPDC058312]|uniref:hypothetical protein n=1 Tax=Cellulomonas sp. NPDC058312 TaxID=3346441 RepID=UPI0036E6A985